MRFSGHITRTLWSMLALSLWCASAQAALEDTCSSDADCGADESCKVTGASGSGGCSSAGMCDQGTTVEYKSCVARVRTCTKDSDCPEATVCADAGGSSVSSNGKTQTGTSASKVCTWKPTSCTADSQCGSAAYGCLEVGREETCSGPGKRTDGREPASTDDGASGPASSSETEGESRDLQETDATGTCTVTLVVKACLPKPIACTTNAQCSGGWACVDAEKLDDGPYDRETSAGYCMPEGIKLAASGHVAVDQIAFGNPPRGGRSESGGGTAAVDKASDDASKKDSGGCSYGGSRTTGTASLTLLALAAAFVELRRLRRLQQTR